MARDNDHVALGVRRYLRSSLKKKYLLDMLNSLKIFFSFTRGVMLRLFFKPQRLQRQKCFVTNLKFKISRLQGEVSSISDDRTVATRERDEEGRTP